MVLLLLSFCLLLLLLWESVIVLCFVVMLLYVHSSIAIILMGKRELVALLNLSSWCLVMVERLFLAVPWGCLRFVIVVIPDHTHLLFFFMRDRLYNNTLSNAFKRVQYRQPCVHQFSLKLCLGFLFFIVCFKNIMR